VASLVRSIVQERVALRERAKQIALDVEGPEGLDVEEVEFLREEGAE
jgi:hypothetical protein